MRREISREDVKGFFQTIGRIPTENEEFYAKALLESHSSRKIRKAIKAGLQSGFGSEKTLFLIEHFLGFQNFHELTKIIRKLKTPVDRKKLEVGIRTMRWVQVKNALKQYASSKMPFWACLQLAEKERVNNNTKLGEFISKFGHTNAIPVNKTSILLKPIATGLAHPMPHVYFMAYPSKEDRSKFYEKLLALEKTGREAFLEHQAGALGNVSAGIYKQGKKTALVIMNIQHRQQFYDLAAGIKTRLKGWHHFVVKKIIQQAKKAGIKDVYIFSPEAVRSTVLLQYPKHERQNVTISENALNQFYEHLPKSMGAKTIETKTFKDLHSNKTVRLNVWKIPT